MRHKADSYTELTTNENASTHTMSFFPWPVTGRPHWYLVLEFIG